MRTQSQRCSASLAATRKPARHTMTSRSGRGARMPQGEVLAYFREKDPRFKDVPDDQLVAYIKDKHPDFAKELGGRQIRTDFQKKAALHEANLLHERAGAEYKQDMANIRNKGIGQALEMAPFAAAAPFTGGTSLPIGAALMGTAGLAGG